jgi:pyrroline-5-carboxylate reductase
LAADDVLRSKKIGVLGAGNLGYAMLKALSESGKVARENLFASSRNNKKLDRLVTDLGITAALTNEELIEKSDVVILGVKPQDLYLAIEPIAASFHSEQVVISLAAGVELSDLRRLITHAPAIIRVIPNTAARLKKSVTAFSATKAAEAQLPWIEELLSVFGYVVRADDEEVLRSIMVAASSGIGFLFEFMIYWQEWLEERGISQAQARKITAELFAGVSALAADSEGTPFEELQKKVVSLKGVTASGLDSMRELEIERALRISFEKAAMRDQELGKNWKPVN